MNTATTPSWPGDVMNRHIVAGFIYTVIQKRQLSTKTTGSICMALDGDWGSGKSFFVERWAEDLKRDGHAVIRFDAWKNDLSDEPLVGLLATLQAETRKIFSTLDVETKFTNIIERQGNKVFKRAKSVIVPATIEIAKGVAAKLVTREAVDAIEAVFSDDEDNPKDESKEKSIVPEKSIEKVFDKILDNHIKKQAAIADFTKELAQLASDLERLGKKNLPIYICIDELDRCRPTYAISLLEGVKHLFNAKGICFVFSTNMAQLSESVKSVYGQGFNGHMYLKRFFDFDYQLPPPDNHAFAKLLLTDSIISSRNCFTAIPENEGHLDGPYVEQDVCISHIASLFNLDLRSQQQIFSKAEAAAAALPQQHTIQLLYLLALAAIQHISPPEFELMRTSEKNPFLETYHARHGKNARFGYFYHSRQGSRERGESTVFAALEKYHNIHTFSKEAIPLREGGKFSPDYTGHIALETYRSLGSGVKSLYAYVELIQLASNFNIHT